MNTEFQLILKRKEEDGQFTEIHASLQGNQHTLPEAGMDHLLKILRDVALVANPRLLVPIYVPKADSVET